MVPLYFPENQLSLMLTLGWLDQQRGFFESYQVVFERFRRQFEVNTTTDAMVRNKRGHGRRSG